MAFAQAVSSLVRTALVSLENQFLETVAKDFNLPIEELREKYKVAADSTSLKRPYKRKATVETIDKDGNKVDVKKSKEDDDRPFCKGTTAKREPCKFHALKGHDFCKRHQEAFELEEARRTGKQPVKTANNGGEPLHTHAPDHIVHDSCDLCQSHGPVLGEFKPVAVTKTLTPEEVNKRLTDIIQNAKEPEEHQAAAVIPGAYAELAAEWEAEDAVEAKEEDDSCLVEEEYDLAESDEDSGPEEHDD
jgi:hypothetical protein